MQAPLLHPRGISQNHMKIGLNQRHVGPYPVEQLKEPNVGKLPNRTQKRAARESGTLLAHKSLSWGILFINGYLTESSYCYLEYPKFLPGRPSSPQQPNIP